MRGVPEFIGDDAQALVLPVLPLGPGLLNPDGLFVLVVPGALDAVGVDVARVVAAVQYFAH